MTSSIRNKRLNIERGRSTYVLVPLNDAEEETLEMSVPALGVTMQFMRCYPFHPPKIMVNGEDHITVLLREYRALGPTRSAYALHLPCICCSTVVCGWSPCSGYADVLDEYVLYSALLKRLTAYAALIPKLPFDPLVHARILDFLC